MKDKREKRLLYLNSIPWKIAEEIQKLIQENTNTKREIKNKTKALGRAVKRLREEVDNYKLPRIEIGVERKEKKRQKQKYALWGYRSQQR